MQDNFVLEDTSSSLTGGRAGALKVLEPRQGERGPIGVVAVADGLGRGVDAH